MMSEKLSEYIEVLRRRQKTEAHQGDDCEFEADQASEKGLLDDADQYRIEAGQHRGAAGAYLEVIGELEKIKEV
jgi:hypothetical protein